MGSKDDDPVPVPATHHRFLRRPSDLASASALAMLPVIPTVVVHACMLPIPDTTPFLLTTTYLRPRSYTLLVLPRRNLFHSATADGHDEDPVSCYGLDRLDLGRLLCFLVGVASTTDHPFHGPPQGTL